MSTAAGKITTAALTPGTRVLITRDRAGKADSIDAGPRWYPATVKRGVVTGTVRNVEATTDRGTMRRRYLVTMDTDAGRATIDAAPSQTFILAPAPTAAPVEPAPVAPTAGPARPTRATYKGHGKPETFVFFGSYRTPDNDPRTVTVTYDGQMFHAIDVETGESCGWFGAASKIWAAPVEQAAPAAPAAERVELTAAQHRMLTEGADRGEIRLITRHSWTVVGKLREAGMVESGSFRITPAGYAAIGRTEPAAEPTEPGTLFDVDPAPVVEPAPAPVRTLPGVEQTTIDGTADPVPFVPTARPVSAPPARPRPAAAMFAADRGQLAGQATLVDAFEAAGTTPDDIDDVDPDAERARCRHDGRPIARRPGALRWWHVDDRGGLHCTDDNGSTLAEPGPADVEPVDQPRPWAELDRLDRVERAAIVAEQVATVDAARWTPEPVDVEPAAPHTPLAYDPAALAADLVAVRGWLSDLQRKAQGNDDRAAAELRRLSLGVHDLLTAVRGARD